MEVDTSSTAQRRRSVDVVVQQMQLQMSMIQIEDQTFISSRQTMESLASLTTTIPSKKASASMIMELSLVDVNRIGSVTDLAKRLAIMISTVSLSRLVTSHPKSLIQLIIVKVMANQITRSP
jgi:hypothetical protein